MQFLRRREYITTIAILLFLILFLGRRDTEVIADPIYDPAPIVYTPDPTVNVVVEPQPYSPCRPGGRSFNRPNYVYGQPLRNVLRFLFTPRFNNR